MRSVNRFVAGKTAKLVALIAVFATAVVFIGLAYADNTAINFEAPAYTTGSINGQNGWGGQNPPGIPINPAIDQAIVTNGAGVPASFGGQSWRLSNFYTSGSFGDMPFSPSLVDEAGETAALNNNGVLAFSGGSRHNHFEAQFSFASADPSGITDNDSYFSTSADRGDGARMSYIRIEDRPTGMDVFFDDYQDVAPFGSLANPSDGCGAGDDFTEVQIANSLSRNVAHTVNVTIDFVDGPRNDVVKVYIDGSLVHTGTTWEDYFRWCTESGGGVPNDAAADQSRTVDSLLFRVGGNLGFLHPANFGKGFFIDNLTLATYDTTSVTMGPQAMEGDLKVHPGDTLKVGYDFTMPGSHAAATVAFLNSKVTFQYTCVSGPGSGTFEIGMQDQTYSDPQNSSAWYPSGDQKSPLVFQGAGPVPNVCGGGLVRLQKGGTFTTLLSSTDKTDKVNIRWHYSANGSAGGWSGTKSVVPK